MYKINSTFTCVSKCMQYDSYNSTDTVTNDRKIFITLRGGVSGIPTPSSQTLGDHRGRHVGVPANR